MAFIENSFYFSYILNIVHTVWYSTPLLVNVQYV